MTNEEKLKSLSTEELADIMSNAIKDCCYCPICEFCALGNDHTSRKFDTCPGTWIQWLKSEVER